MNDEKLEPMDPHLLELLRSNAPKIGAPEDAAGRVAKRLALTLPITAMGGAIGGSSSPSAPSNAGVANAGVASAGKTASALWGAKIVGPLAVALTVGAGAALLYVRTEKKERVVTMATEYSPARPTPAPESAPPSVSVEDLPMAAPAAPRTKTVGRDPFAGGSASPAPPASVLTDDVQIEQKMLDDARVALVRGDASGCLLLLEQDRARYPAGALSEEREALVVRTLVALGRTGEAKERATRFLSRYPTSMMRPVVEPALGNDEGR